MIGHIYLSDGRAMKEVELTGDGGLLTGLVRQVLQSGLKVAGRQLS